MKQYNFNFDSIEKALDTSLIIDNLRCRMLSIKMIIENREQLEIQDEYIDIMYKQYIELEQELTMYIKMFYDNVYDSFEKYDNKMQEMTVDIEE